MASSKQTPKAKWKWLDDHECGSVWQPYDNETNEQIEAAYNSGVSSIKLTKGSYFGRYENQIYSVIFNRQKYPVECRQKNNQTNNSRLLKREHKHYQPQQSSSLLPTNAICQITDRLSDMKIKDDQKQFGVANLMGGSNNNVANKNVLGGIWSWNNNGIWQNFDNQASKEIDDVLRNQWKNTNSKVICFPLTKGPWFSKSSNLGTYFCNIILNHSRTKIKGVVQQNTKTGFPRQMKRTPPFQLDTHQKSNNNNKNHNNQNSKNKSQQSDDNAIRQKHGTQHQARHDNDPYHCGYEIGDYIEIFANNVWIPAKISKTEPLNIKNHKNFERSKMIYVEYQDTKTLQNTQLKLHGLRDKNKFRVLGSGFYSDYHKFNFEYMSNDKNNKASNAKHPAAYINRECFHCEGKGIIYQNNNNNNNIPCNQCNCTGIVTLNCNKCNGDGIYKQPFSMTHNKCNGVGCYQCKGTGKYPVNIWICKYCKGSAIRKVKCNACDGQKERSVSSSKEHKKCNKCISGYFMNRIVDFTPKRDDAIKVHGQMGNKNVIRLYHATNKAGADGIRQFGVMCRGQSGSYGGGIYFAVSPETAKERARKSGYLVIADVYVGKYKQETSVSTDMDFIALNNMGYDSIKGTWSQEGIEWVVYCWDQVWVHVVVAFNKVDFGQLKYF